MKYSNNFVNEIFVNEIFVNKTLKIFKTITLSLHDVSQISKC